MARIDILVEASLATDLDDLSPANVNDQGECDLIGLHRISIDWPQGKSLGDIMARGLDIFRAERHDFDLDDFHIVARRRGRYDLDRDLIDMGEFSFASEPEPGPEP